MKCKKLGKDEIHTIILDMAKIIHGIMERNEIPYYMLGGSILGAVRHRGFIPWDDDFDIGVPRNYWEKMIEALDRELPQYYRFINYERSSGLFLGIGKIEYVNSKVHEFIYKDVPEKDKLGLTIDIFPLDQISLPFPAYRRIRFYQRLQFLLFSISKHDTISKKICRFFSRLLLRTCFKIPKNSLPRKIDRLAIKKSDPNGTFYLSTWSHYYLNVASLEVYGMPTKYPFENTFFYGPEHADEYLKGLFGDYMKLPPKEKQVYHSEDVFLIEQGE